MEGASASPTSNLVLTSPDSDVKLIDDEVFDFDLSLSPKSSSGSKNSLELEDAVGDDEVFFGPVKHKENCLSTAIDLTEKDAASEIPMPALTAQEMAQICVEAQRIACQLELAVTPSIHRTPKTTTRITRRSISTPMSRDELLELTSFSNAKSSSSTSKSPKFSPLKPLNLNLSSFASNSQKSVVDKVETSKIALFASKPQKSEAIETKPRKTTDAQNVKTALDNSSTGVSKAVSKLRAPTGIKSGLPAPKKSFLKPPGASAASQATKPSNNATTNSRLERRKIESAHHANNKVNNSGAGVKRSASLQLKRPSNGNKSGEASKKNVEQSSSEVPRTTRLQSPPAASKPAIKSALTPLDLTKPAAFQSNLRLRQASKLPSSSIPGLSHAPMKATKSTELEAPAAVVRKLQPVSKVARPRPVPALPPSSPGSQGTGRKRAFSSISESNADMSSTRRNSALGSVSSAHSESSMSSTPASCRSAKRRSCIATPQRSSTSSSAFSPAPKRASVSSIATPKRASISSVGGRNTRNSLSSVGTQGDSPAMNTRGRHQS